MAEEMKNPAENAAGEENLSDVFRVRREKLAALCAAGFISCLFYNKTAPK